MNKLKILSIPICFLLAALWSEPRCAETFKSKLDKCDTLDNYSDLLSEIYDDEEKVSDLTKEFLSSKTFDCEERLTFYKTLKEENVDDKNVKKFWKKVISEDCPSDDAEQLNFVETLLNNDIKDEAQSIFNLINHKNLTDDPDAQNLYASLSKQYFSSK